MPAGTEPPELDALSIATIRTLCIDAIQAANSGHPGNPMEMAPGRVHALWASTSTKDPAASDSLYVHGLAAPFTVNTMPGETLQAFADHGEVGDPLPADGGDADEMLARFSEAGVDVDALAQELQTKGAEAFVDSWNELLATIEKASSSG